MSNTYCDKHKKRKSILFGNVTYCTECDKQPEEVKETNEDGFHIPAAPTFVEEHFYYAVLENRSKWKTSPQYARLCQDLSAATVEVQLKNQASMGRFKIAKVVTSIDCKEWLPSGISSPAYAIWNGAENTPPNPNGRYATLMEWIRPQSGNSVPSLQKSFGYGKGFASGKRANTGRIGSKKKTTP